MPAAAPIAGARTASPDWSDSAQRLCLAVALWNTRDPILKERLFGLTNGEGNHGEDVKELYYYLDATPTHSYLKMLYKYPQGEYPYRRLLEENRQRGMQQPEYELIDTGVFDEDRYFDVFVEYAQGEPDDILMRIGVTNRGPQSARRCTCCRSSGSATPGAGSAMRPSRGSRRAVARTVQARHASLGDYQLHADGEPGEILFCDNETNRCGSGTIARERATGRMPFTSASCVGSSMRSIPRRRAPRRRYGTGWRYPPAGVASSSCGSPGERSRHRFGTSRRCSIPGGARPMSSTRSLQQGIESARCARSTASGVRRHDLEQAVLLSRHPAMARTAIRRSPRRRWNGVAAAIATGRI